jgi:hypothetical protein
MLHQFCEEHSLPVVGTFEKIDEMTERQFDLGGPERFPDA